MYAKYLWCQEWCKKKKSGQRRHSRIFWYTSFENSFCQKLKLFCQAWGNQRQAILDLGSGPPPPIYLREFWEHSQNIWGGLSTNLEKKMFLCEKFLPTPRNAPMVSKGLLVGSKMTQIFW